MFSFFKKKPLFTVDENEIIVQAIRQAEMRTSGEVRVFVESHCRFIDPMDRALEIFAKLQMGNTQFRNAVILYIALKDHQVAVYGDVGINEKVGEEFWKASIQRILSHFNRLDYAGGISKSVTEIGESLAYHFPYSKELDKNELPDEIIFGR